MSFNHGEHAGPMYGHRLSVPHRRSSMPRHISYMSSKSRQGDDWEDWEDDDVVTLIDVTETPSADDPDPDHKKLAFSNTFLDMSASSSAANTRAPSPLERDSFSISSDDESTPIEEDSQPGLLAPPPTPAAILTKAPRHPSIKISMRRSTARINRPVSRRPPKQRNAKLGISLITDMTKLGRRGFQAKSPARRAPKFVDVAALRALEGSPNPQSVGNWNWLKKEDGESQMAASPAQYTRSPDEQLSPEDRPIVIGITLPSDEVASRGIDPLTATVNNIDTPNGMKNPFPFTFQAVNNPANGRANDRGLDAKSPPSAHQLRSVWSPDTPDTASSFGTVRYPSSVYSQASMAPGMGHGLRDDEVPPVPALPANYKSATTAQPRLIGTELRKSEEGEDDSGTPCTLFEEDGVTPLKSPAGKLSALTPQSVRGWWDHHLVTPFLDKRMSFASRRTQMESPLIADNKGESGSALTPKLRMSRQSWKTILSRTDTKQGSPSVGRKEQKTPTVPNFGDGRAILGLSVLEKEQSPSVSPDMPEDLKGKGPQNMPYMVSRMDSTDIMINLDTDEEKKSSERLKAVDESSTLTSRAETYQQSSSRSHDVTTSEVSKSEQVHRYDFTSVEVKEQQTLSVESQQRREPQRDLTPPPGPRWQEAKAPIIRVPTPRQTPPPREVVVREASERPIVVHIEINTGEQQQKFVVDRVGVNSTPTIRIPTPRRTPSPRGGVVTRAEVLAEPTRGALEQNGLDARERPQGLGITNLAADTVPPSAPKKEGGAAVKYQPVFPPDHHLHSQFSPREAHPVAASTAVAAAAAPIAYEATRAAMAETSRENGHETNGAVTSLYESGASSSQTSRRVERAEESHSDSREISATARLGGVSLSSRNVDDVSGNTSNNVTRSAGIQQLAHERETQASSAMARQTNRASTSSSQVSQRIERVDRSTQEARHGTREVSATARLGGVSLFSRNTEETSSNASNNASRSVGIQQPASEQQSRFSVSPTSSTSPRDRDSRTTPRHVRAASNFVSSVLSRQRSPVDQRRGGEAFAVQPVDMVLEERRAPEANPVAPEVAYLTINETRSPTMEHGYTMSLPARPPGTSLAQEHADPASGKEYKIERKRRRHEKEEMMARRAGGFWRGRGCVPDKGCFGRPGPEGRKKRRIWLWIILILLLLLIILGVVLAIVLTRHHGSGTQSQTPAQGQPDSTSPSTPTSVDVPPSIWVNLTDYPAMPTGVLTFVGPNNTVAKSDCTKPSTLWSCSLPKDSQDSVSPFKPNQPTLIFEIQWDNSTQRAWNVPNGTPPTAVSKRDESNSNSSIDGFTPDPSPPTFQEMWFLGETTDNIQSSQKAGEPTPFFISVLKSLNDTVKPPSSLSRRAAAPSDINITDIIFPPDLNADGTPAPAVMLPNPVQQPVRLFDRGLPTEHYGFYTYFQRTIYLKSVTAFNGTNQGNVPLDEDGGCSETEANHLVTWAETRMLVQIWTRKLNSTASLLTADGIGGIDNATALVRPGTMPYPVTVTLDTHGGDPNHKVVWEWPMDDRQKLNTSAPELLANNMAAGGTWINHRGSGNATFGGFDGGTGGCQCQWVNWT